jgi:hypothetical protein
LTPVLSKKENYRLFQSHAFGNKLRDWRTPEELRESGFSGTVSLRTLMAGGGPCRYHMFPGQAIGMRDKWIQQGMLPSNIVFGEMAPDNSIVLQGEYLNGDLENPHASVFEHLTYSREQHPMRTALAIEHLDVSGLWARLLLREAMTPASWENFTRLQDLYPGHVIEVSVYDKCLGDTPGNNAIVWEVRRY